MAPTTIKELKVIKPYHATAKELVQELQTDSDKGLSSAEVAQRLTTYGFNKQIEEKPTPLFFVFLGQFRNPLIYILLLAASIIFFLGNHADAFIISGVLFFNAIIGTIQEGRTHTMLKSLRSYITTNCIVIRDGVQDIISDEQLVPGDLIVLQEGEKIPADARVIQSNALLVDESLLTGESEPMHKIIDWVSEDAPVYAQKNMVFRGTYILSGSGRAIVTATGSTTEVGRLQKVVESIHTDIPLQRELDKLSHTILLFILGICSFLLLIGLYHGKQFNDLLVMLTALFICVVPEGLPVVLTLVLVTGAYRMAQQKVLVKKLQGVDTLGRTEIAIIDKTGTLTRNELIVHKIWADGKAYDVSGVGYFTQGAVTLRGAEVTTSETHLNQMGLAACLMSQAAVKLNPETNTFALEGDPTQAALSVFAQKIGCNRLHLEQSYTLLFDSSFNPTTRLHIAAFSHNNKGIVYVLGSPEPIMERSGITAEDDHALHRMLDQGLRVIALATKEFDLGTLTSGKSELSWFEQLTAQDLNFIGLYGIQDTIRPDVQVAIEQARNAGLHVVMATGDHITTALYVARHVGIFNEGDEYLEGAEFDQLSQEELIRRIYKITVYARLTPENKLKLVRLFHKLGKTVAMTGDGVNDAPSLVAADVGIAMGGIGTQVAKEAADVILLNDSFAHIINAIELGRHISYALRRVILYFFATNLGEVLVVFFALGANMPVPILASQILWLNLVTDGFLDIALAMEPQEEGLLQKKWLKKRGKLVDGRLLLKVCYMALPMGIGTILIFNWYQFDLDKARTMALLTMAMYQWFNAWNCRSETKSVFQSGLFSNRWLILATAFVALLQYLVVTVPVLQHLFHTVPLTMHEFGIVLLATVPLFVIEELRKLVVRVWWRT
jgi:Ca2+-transporting ATPase